MSDLKGNSPFWEPDHISRFEGTARAGDRREMCEVLTSLHKTRRESYSLSCEIWIELIEWPD